MKPIIALTIGDHNGIGPETALKSVMRPQVRAVCTPVLVGPLPAFRFYADRYRLSLSLQLVEAGASLLVARHIVPVIESSQISSKAIMPGRISATAGRTAARAIEYTVQLALGGIVGGMVTGPVSKKAMHKAGVQFPGQTEMLQMLSCSPHVAMMLVSPTMRVGLATIHIPIDKVAGSLSRSLLRERIKIIHRAMITDWKIKKPRIAVLALNPHAGEGGDIGSEDTLVVSPVVKELRTGLMNIEGPFPADSFFGRYKPHAYDAIVAMYHDQGLIPLKMSSFGKGVNVSLGLPIVRTSPDHGTAFDIAGKGIADPGSMIEAIKLAAFIASNRGSRQHRVKR